MSALPGPAAVRSAAGTGTADEPGPRRHDDPPERWDVEELFFDGRRWFDDLLEGIRAARSSVELEMYIFARDRIGRRVAAALIRAARRGVTVRVVVDGVGSPGWRRQFARGFERAGIPFQVHNELPWDRLLSPRPRGLGRRTLAQLASGLNRRDHRTLMVVDRRRAWTGSRNIADVHHDPPGEPPWRDTSVALEGDAVADLGRAFEVLWQHGQRRFRLRELRRWRRRSRVDSPLVRLNASRAQRRAHLRLLVHGLHRARERIWITSAYFVPRRAVLDALEAAARRGVDVRVIVPQRSDVPFIPWVTATYYERLRRAGVRLFEFRPANLHAKSSIVDDRHTVGTANMNHRSAIHDLEIDVVLTHADSHRALEERFRRDLDGSEPVTSVSAARPLPVRAVGHTLLFFRHFL